MDVRVEDGKVIATMTWDEANLVGDAALSAPVGEPSFVGLYHGFHGDAEGMAAERKEVLAGAFQLATFAVQLYAAAGEADDRPPDEDDGGAR